MSRHRSRRFVSSPFWLGLAVLTIALPATALAPAAQYLGFDTAATEIQDLKTTLVWDRKRVVKQADPSAAQTYCASTVFPANNGRVPTIKELLTLVDEEPHAEYDTFFKPPFVQKNLDQNAFSDSNAPIEKPYWSSTPGPGADEFWTLDFQTGKTAISKTAAGPLYVRCVR